MTKEDQKRHFDTIDKRLSIYNRLVEKWRQFLENFFNEYSDFNQQARKEAVHIILSKIAGEISSGNKKENDPSLRNLMIKEVQDFLHSERLKSRKKVLTKPNNQEKEKNKDGKGNGYGENFENYYALLKKLLKGGYLEDESEKNKFEVICVRFLVLCFLEERYSMIDKEIEKCIPPNERKIVEVLRQGSFILSFSIKRNLLIKRYGFIKKMFSNITMSQFYNYIGDIKDGLCPYLKENGKKLGINEKVIETFVKLLD